MKINIVVELENENYCNGCSCLAFDNCEVNYCGHGYDLPAEGKYNNKIGDRIQPRPDICKEQNKEVHNG